MASQIVNPVSRFWSLVKEERSDITAIYFFAIFSGLIQLSLPVGIQAIIGFVLGGTLSASLVVLISLIVVGVLLTGIMQINQMKVIERIQQRIFARYAYAFADRIPRLDLKSMDDYYLPELVNRFLDTASLQKSFSKLLLDLPTAMIQILFGVILLSFYHPFFILFGLVLLLLLGSILYFTGGNGLQSSIKESTAKYSVVAWLEEVARLVRSFKATSGTDLSFKKTNQRTINYLDARTKHFGVLLFQYRTLVLLKVAITAAMLIVGTTLLLNQQLNIGQFVAAEIIILTVINAVEKIIINLDSVYDAFTAVEKVHKITDKPVEASGSLVFSPRSAVKVDAIDLTFSYNNDRPVIERLNFSVAAGNKVCISGANGKGKSTLLKLLAGIYPDFEGTLCMNDIPLRNFNLQSLRDHTGMLFPQENIFNGTLWENLTMGRGDCSIEYVTELIQKVGLQPFFSGLDQGFETELDPAGIRLPRNVIFKILLVRALSNKPKLLVLEEPWQGVEEHLELDIQQLLLSLPDTTVIVATNNKSFARQCDQIIQLV